MELKQGDRVFVSVATNSAWTGTGVVTKTRNGTPLCLRENGNWKNGKMRWRVQS
jgi:hypothetical protein